MPLTSFSAKSSVEKRASLPSVSGAAEHIKNSGGHVLKKHAVFLSFAASFLLSACASYRPIVDMKGVDSARYETDLAECQRYADQLSPGAHAAAGAGIGAIIGGAIGAILCGRDCANAGAGIGAVQGVAAGGAEGASGQVDIIRRCMTNRGYAVLR